VVGDDRQLPPSQFFSKMLGDVHIQSPAALVSGIGIVQRPAGQVWRRKRAARPVRFAS
jgi:hypothetical protein